MSAIIRKTLELCKLKKREGLTETINALVTTYHQAYYFKILDLIGSTKKPANWRENEGELLLPFPELQTLAELTIAVRIISFDTT